jgi:hypothetical protein
MDESQLYAQLEKRFVGTFLNELMPGIFHNFANPLNGIMGRSKLMQRRLDDFVKKIEMRYPDIENEMGADYKKLKYDINAISVESDKFYSMFRVATGKFYILGTQGVEKLNLSKLIEAELAFADFYLDYKHHIKKDIHLDMEIPDIEGITAFYSIAIWVLIRLATNNLQQHNTNAFHIATTRDNQWVIMRISHIGSSLVHRWRGVSFPVNIDLETLSNDTDEQIALTYALMLIKQSGHGIEIAHDSKTDLVTIRIPYHQ